MDDLVGASPNDNVTGGASTIQSTAVGGGPAASTIYDVAGGTRPKKGKKPLRPAPVMSDKYATGEVTDNAVIGAGTEIMQRANEAAQLRKEEQSFGLPWQTDTTFGATYRQTMAPTVALLERNFSKDFKADPAWIDERNRKWPEYMGGFSQHEQESLMDAESQADYDFRVERIRTERTDNATLSNASMGGRLTAGLASGLLDPTNYIAGYGAAKMVGAAGYGAARFALQARPGLAVVSNIGENVLGNVAYEAALDLAGEHRSVADYGIAIAQGAALSAVTGPLVYKQAQAAFAANVHKQVFAANMALAERAQKNVGVDAPVEVQRKEMKRLEAEDLQKIRTTHMSTAADVDRLPAHNLDESPIVEDDFTIDSVRQQNQDGSAMADMKGYSGKSFTGIDATIDDKFLKSITPGTHLAPSIAADPFYQALHKSTLPIVRDMLPGRKVIIAGVDGNDALNGQMAANKSTDVITIQVNKRLGDAAPTTLVHELGHAIKVAHFKNASPEIQAGVLKMFEDFSTLANTKGKAGSALSMRSPIARQEKLAFTDGNVSLREGMLKRNMGDTSYVDDYWLGFEEITAEQFAKYAEAGALGVGKGKDVNWSQQIVDSAKALYKRLLELFTRAADRGLLGADPRFEDFFESVRAKVAAGEGRPGVARDTGEIGTLQHDISQKYGLDLMPQGTPRERAEYKAVRDIYIKAEQWNAENPTDVEALKNLIGNNDTFNVALPATLLASSDNPVARMIAGTLLENATGASGRRRTAAIAKDLHERSFIGNALLEYDNMYAAWRQEHGGGALKDHFDPELRNRFNRDVAMEQDARLRDEETTSHALVKQAADALERSYERMRLAQVDAQTVGWARLPESSRGYMPHVLAAERLQTLTLDEQRMFTDVLSKQFQDIEGFSTEFSQELARSYINHARINARGGHEIPANVHNPAAADMVRGALEAMGMSKEEVAAAMGRYAAGGASHTKKRLHLNLTQEFTKADGSKTTLMELFNTDQLSLLRNYARRVSGEVALSQNGVMGAQGLSLLRSALMQGGSAQADNRVMEAFDQTAAEFLGRPFGTAKSKALDRLLSATSIARLGGMGWPQLGESLNGIWAVGVKNTLDSIVDMPRLRAEVSALARGEKVHNSLLSSMEQWGGGGEWGLDGYKMVTAYDNPENVHASYGNSSVTWFDRALRTGSHLMGSLSMHRMIQATQVRGMSEQITSKALKYIRDGGNDKALADMGFTQSLVEKFRGDLDNMVKWDANGNVAEFDITKATQGDAADEFITAVRRGTHQIIQGSFIGEVGKWTHSDMGRLLTQFRNFPLVALEKQWGRNKLNHGVAGALGILAGSMAFVAPIYMARIAAQAVGRPDREAYLDKMLDPMQIARASLNYVGSSGFAGELIDLLGPVLDFEQTGGRQGAAKGLVGKFIPAAGYLDDIYKTAQDPDAHKIAKLLPGANTPMLMIGVNALKED